MGGGETRGEWEGRGMGAWLGKEPAATGMYDQDIGDAVKSRRDTRVMGECKRQANDGGEQANDGGVVG